MDPNIDPQTKSDLSNFIPKHRYTKEDIDCLFQSVNSNDISQKDKITILEQAVVPCPEIEIQIKNNSPKSLLDSGSMVTLVTESYFEENIKPLITNAKSGVSEAHSLFNLQGAGENHIPLSQYFTCDITIGGMTIPEVGILVKTNRQLTTSKGTKTRLPVIVGCNLFRLATLKFIRDYGEEALKLFECPRVVDPLFFSCILLYYYSELQRESEKSQDVGEEANGKRGVGAAHMASSCIEQEEDTIGFSSEKKSKGSTNFPSKKKV